jgi:hypothetical protein
MKAMPIGREAEELVQILMPLREAGLGHSGVLPVSKLKKSLGLADFAVPQFQRSRYFSNRPAAPKISRTTARIKRMSANMRAAL